MQEETKIVDDLRGGKLPVTPFHWEIEFPEVFARENPGFDAFVGNPPFLGGKKISYDSHGNAYLRLACKCILTSSSWQCDFVAHFFRRAFNLCAKQGTFGLIATNTIAQGDTRSTGLRWICTSWGDNLCSTKTRKVARPAAVVVSVVHIVKGTYVVQSGS